jgi:hypothetical protein
MKVRDITIPFPNYNGRRDYDLVTSFIQDKFKQVIKHNTPTEFIFGSAMVGSDVNNIIKVTDALFIKKT